jgi:alpha/beta superfamily hydrolase
MSQETIKITSHGCSLEGVINRPISNLNDGVLLLHPHPLYGGNKENHVVKDLEYAFLQFGFTTFRFDFRGVSSCSEEFAGIAGAVEDTLKALELMESYELRSIGLVGYSFGGSTALRIASSKSISFLVTLSASYDLLLEGGFDESNLTNISCPVLMFHGRSDRMIPYSDLGIFSSHIGNIRTVILENENHFYERSLPQVVDAIHTFISKSVDLDSR